ncbi:MAG: protoporphyrinogen oxidase [Bdellovibrionia bacterium]
MLGSLDTKDRDVTVIGGGIAGLLAAYFLDRAGYSVTLREASSRLGGLIQTEKTPFGISEWAAHSLLVTPEVKRLCDELGVELVSINAASMARYILRQGVFRTFPLSIREVIGAFLRAYFVWAPRRPVPKNLTMREWSNRFFGASVSKYLVTPMLRGIYGATPDAITVGAAFPSVVVPLGHSFLSFQLAKLLRGKIRLFKRPPRPQIMAPRRGMEDFVKALEIKLRERLGSRLILNAPVTRLPLGRNIVLALPAKGAGDLLATADPVLSQLLKRAKYTPLAAVTVFVERAGFVRKSQNMPLGVPQGVGVLMPEGEDANTLGILFNSSSFVGRVNSEPNSPWVSLTAFLGGEQKPEELKFSDEVIVAMIKEDLEKLFGFRGEISGFRIRRWENAVPQYNQYLTELWDAARQGWCSQAGKILFGNYTGQVSIRGMIESASKIATSWQRE